MSDNNGPRMKHPERARTDLSVEQRVDEITRMMAAGEWSSAASALQLAERWGVSTRTIHSHAAEAARKIRELVRENKDEVFAVLLGSLARITQVMVQAVEEPPSVSDSGTRTTDRAGCARAAIAALELQAKLLRVDEDPRVRIPDMSGVPLEEKKRRLLTMRAAIDEYERNVDSELRAEQKDDGT